MAKALTSCMKALFLLFNSIFLLSGFGLLALGIVMQVQFKYLLKLSTDINYNLAPYIMIACGVFIVLVGFVGCWAAMKEHGWALKIYMVILVLLVIVEISGGIAGYVMKNKIADGLEKGLTDAVNNYNTNTDSKEAMDKIQSEIVKCCGVNNYTDYDKMVGNDTKTYIVPDSCCKDKNNCKTILPVTGNTNATDTGLYQQGCYSKLVSETKDNFKIFGGVALGIAVFQILGILFGYLLTRQFSGNSYESM